MSPAGSAKAPGSGFRYYVSPKSGKFATCSNKLVAFVFRGANDAEARDVRWLKRGKERLACGAWRKFG